MKTFISIIIPAKRIFNLFPVLAIVITFSPICYKANAQDPQFSQFYAAPLDLNPALTGINQRGRIGINYRNQWPSIETGFETAAIYADYNIEEYNSSVGILFNNDQEGLAGLNSTSCLLYTSPSPRDA